MLKIKFQTIFFSFFVIFLGALPEKVNGQKSELSSTFHKNQRLQLREKLPNNTVAVFFSAPIRNRANDVDYEYHQDPNFYYLTGWEEPHAVLLVFSVPQQDEDGTYFEKLYVRERDAQNEMWNGKRLGVAGAAKMGFDRVVLKQNFLTDQLDFNQFDRVLMFDFENDVRDGKSDSSDLYDLQQHFKKEINFPENFDADRYRLYQRIRQAELTEVPYIKRVINYMAETDPSLKEDPVIQDFVNNAEDETILTDLKTRSAYLLKDYNFDVDQLGMYMANLREVKLPEEIRLLKKAIRISTQGQREVMKAIHPEMTEREVQGIHQLVYKKYGAAHEGYPSIVGAGDNACVLHYITNDKTDIENQLILMDLGAEYNGYTADVTRTIPVSGRFTKDQRALYQIVFDAQTAGINAAQNGASFRDVGEASYKVVQEGLLKLGIIKNPKEFRRYLPHGISHHIGLDVHDPRFSPNLKPNMVITVEPGIYIPEGSPCDPKWWNIGIRIEDDILITDKGPVNLSDDAPRRWDEIEALMKKKSALDDFTLPPLNID
ncbi:MAG: aminopeptidase P N-terminal domain-containing protein [Flavobacteriaceae bacterium]